MLIRMNGDSVALVVCAQYQGTLADALQAVESGMRKSAFTQYEILPPSDYAEYYEMGMAHFRSTMITENITWSWIDQPSYLFCTYKKENGVKRSVSRVLRLVKIDRSHMNEVRNVLAREREEGTEPKGNTN